MDQFDRYAVYFLPPAGSGLAVFGAAWLGWDPVTATKVARPDLPGLPAPVEDLTSMPRKYGFHGTLKPPFRLAEGTTLDGLKAALADLTKTLPFFDMPPLALRSLGHFLALVPSMPSPQLADMAGKLVTGLDDFRAPAGVAELARRRAAGLSPRQEENLTRWGYPYVLEDFRFHMTLTGRLTPPDAEQIRSALSPVVAPLCQNAVPVKEVCLMGERGGFHEVIQRFALKG